MNHSIKWPVQELGSIGPIFALVNGFPGCRIQEILITYFAGFREAHFRKQRLRPHSRAWNCKETTVQLPAHLHALSYEECGQALSLVAFLDRQQETIKIQLWRRKYCLGKIRLNNIFINLEYLNQFIWNPDPWIPSNLFFGLDYC